MISLEYFQDKQMEALVEKLCNRFSGVTGMHSLNIPIFSFAKLILRFYSSNNDMYKYITADIRQWEYISYCLSQLAFTEKGMKKLMELFKTFEHALSEDSVMDHFRSIINKVLSVLLGYLHLVIYKFNCLH